MNAVTLQWITVLFIISLHSSCISAGWSKWGEFSPCSRSCGGGAKYRERLCVVDRVDRDVCKGKRINYKLCNIQDCDGPVRDFRLAQCEEYNGVPLDGEIYKWKPYYGHGETCQLLCYAEGYEFYHKLADKVIDGTSCKRSNDRICIQGKCMSVGCDTKIGSTRKTDECGVCGGDNSTCAPREDVSGLFDGELSPGYTTLVEIPAGSTDIVIKELGENENSIVLWDSQGDNLAIDSETRPLLPAVEFTGTKFIYTPENPRNMYGTLQAVGPTDLDITVYAVSQDGANPGISYKFTLPRGLHSSHSKDHTLPYNTNSAIDESNNQNQSKSRDQKPEVQANSKPSNIQISASRVPKHRNSYWKNAVNGVRRRHREKTDAKTKTVKNTQDFEEKQNTKQFVYTNGVQVLGGEKTIQNNVFVDEILYKPDEKEAKWVPSQTTQSFRNSVQELRNADERSDGFTSRRELEGLRPETQEILQSDQRYMWSFGGWTHCDVQCGNGVQRRIVSCVDREERKTVSQQLCPIESRPINAQRCYKGECGPDSPDTYVRWQTGGWSKCSRTCNLGEQKQEVYCEAVMADSTARRVEEQQCLDVYKLKPEYMRSCNEDVTCDGGQEELFTWITSPWGPCSVTCGRGFQRRQVHCASNMEDDRRRDEFYCDQEPRPRDTQRCQTSACVLVEPSTARPRPHPRSCQRSYYGCCPDGVTAARGSRFEGCPSYQPPTTTTTQRPVVSPTTTRRLSPDRSNDCHQMYYGCCPDGETPARGWQLEGCPTTHEERPSRDCRRSQYGCCPDGRTPAQGWTLEGCPSVEVRSTARPMPPERIKCWQTHYGCCPDGETPARGRNYEGCENRRSGVFQVNQGDTVVILCASLTSDDLGRTYLVEWRKEGQDKSVIVQYSNAEPQLPNSYYAGRVRVVDDISLQLSGARLEDAGLYTCAVRTSLQKREDSQLYTRTAYLDVNIAATAKPEIVTNRGSLNGFPRFTQQPKSMTIKAGSTAQLSCAARGQPEPTISWLKDGSADFLAARERRMHASSDGDLFYIMDVKQADQGIYSCLASNEIGMIAADAMLSVLQNIVISDDDANNFVPRPAPSNTVSDQCRQPSERGPGTNYVVMWYYDHANQRCDRFWYGGEGGNGNRFANEDECVSTCKNPTSTKSDEDVCSLPSVTGRCRARLYRWYYNKDRKECLQFVYGGCDGNANNFKSQEDCQRECLSGTSALGDEPTCRRTTYGCCPDQKTAATGNNYEGCPSLCSGTTYGCCDDDQTPAQGPNQEGCEMIEISSGDGADCDMSDHGCCPDGVTEAKGPNGAGCDDDTGIDVDGENTDGTDIDIEIPAQCKFSKETGPCREDLKVMWYYDVQSARCQQFWYGCQGNANRFKSEKECLTTCQRVVKETETPEVAVCDQPKEIGPCRGALPRYFYNRRTGNCEFFQYGGCRGNNNNFQTVEECEQRCNGRALTPQEICYQPSETGPCRALQPKFFYNRETRNCERFNYGGCGGNRNNFETITECQNFCGADIPIRPVPRPTPRERPESSLEICNQPSEIGRCRAIKPRYFYNRETRQCERFNYGGCGGNRNNFETITECQNFCGADIPSRPVTRPTPEERPESSLEICNQPSEIGRCRAIKPRYFYNRETRRCERFNYGGCGGNRNNFETITECQNFCGADIPFRPVPRPTPEERPESSSEICNQPSEIGRCRAIKPRYFYNRETRQCERFNYGGCGGNRNNFETITECQNFCGADIPIRPVTRPSPEEQPESSSEICNQPSETGRCRAIKPRYFYNRETRNCERFNYGGCGGNRNNFETITECQNFCGADIPFRPVPRPTPEERPESSLEICNLPSETGPCRALQPKFFYNRETRNCERFNYGGCGGNRNNFETITECQNFCGADIPIRPVPRPTPEERPESSSEICNQPSETGRCLAIKPRYFYNRETRNCERFNYGGCGGNRNNFETITECQNFCGADIPIRPVTRPTPEERPESSSEICNQPSETGRCRAIKPRYFYNHETRKCERFNYGGCGGNRNNFETITECQNFCDADIPFRPVPRPTPEERPESSLEICNLPSETGPCRALQPKFFYNRKTRNCERFNYGGCGGNRNNFETFTECQNFCGADIPIRPVPRPTPEERPESSLEICNQPSETGRCFAIKPRYFYNRETRQCERFNYGGCGGNRNNFETITECQNFCDAEIPIRPVPRPTPEERPESSSEICNQPSETGRCRAIKPRYFYNHETRKCERFNYGGCGGNRNNFETITECQNFCGAGIPSRPVTRPTPRERPESSLEICNLPSETGPCRALQPKFFYNRETRNCERFNYGGCGGNRNNFETITECQNFCGADIPIRPVPRPTPEERPESSSEICNQPSETGRCRAIKPRYFYNRETRKCERFNYGGCGGNRNNFETITECQNFCDAEIPIRPVPRPTPEERLLTPEEICRQPSETGPCRALITKYYYNHETRLCEAFNYGGCGGNRNKFDTITECQNYCGADIPIRPVTRPTPRDRQSVCEYNSDFGPCDRVVTKYAYNIQTLQCEPFSYGGCLGNLNNFQSEEKCLQYCGLRQQRSRIEDCRLPSERGPCRGDIERWFYDSRTGSCKEFSYGGCQGNINNFATETECLYVCSDAQVKPVTPRPPVRTPAPPTQDEDICNLPLRTPCDNGTPGPYWYYNTGEGECREVPNGECNNNRNSFTSKEQCEGYCGRESVCKPLTYSSDIRCLAYMERFTYNEDTNECEQFVYGGCGGTANNFDTKAACDRKCKRDVTVVTEKPDTSTPAEICALPENSGNCLAYLRNWRYDSLTGQCVQFIYGGCGGNENNFKTKEACERFCTRQVVCQEFEEPLIGCFAYIPRWRYDPSTRSCENFVYGGCGGNANNFQSSEACEGKCVASTTPVDEDKEQVTRRVSTWTEICNMQADVGPCKSYVQKYHYNSLSQQCETFQYGGCLGNSNNFESREQCLMYCDSSRWAPGPARTTTPDPDMTTEGSGEITTDAPVTGVAVCALESETGVCRAFIRMWYYDFRSGQCQQFTYGGCGGNENRFQSQEECERQCSPREVCVLPRRTGVCLANIPRFYFDYAAQDCFEFVYGGCDGNANSFETKDQCLRRCDPLINRRPATTVSPGKEKEAGEEILGGGLVVPGLILAPRPVEDEEDPSPSGVRGGAPEVGGIALPGVGGGAPQVPAQKSGYCPPRVDMAGLLYACPPSCREDQDCGGKQKCCNHGCGDKCVDPVDVEPYQMNPPVRVLANAVSPDTIHLNWQDPSLGNDQMIRDNRYYTIKYYSYNQGGVTYRNVTDLRAHINTLSPDTEYHFLVRVNDPPYLSEWSEETMNKTRSHSGYDVCSLAKDPGSCDDWEVRWYYNKDSSECERFWFGGCDQGNENNFDNELACENRCKGFVVTTTEAPVPYSCRRTVFGCCSDGYTTKVDSAGSNCEVEMKPGSCPALQTDSMGICVEECQEDRDCDGVKKCCSNGCGNVCVPPAGYNVCTLPKDPGSCTDWEVRWYYNTSIEQCERFWYGGCNQGNENNFKNELACKSRCGTPEGPVYTPRPPFSCRRSIYGCCKDAYTAKIDSDGTNCEEYVNPTDEVIVPATPGESATLTCRYSANVTWYKDGKLVVNDERRRVGSDGTLEVYAATYEDDGLYACHVTRGNRPVIYKYFLQVQIPIGILPGPEKIMVKPGRQAFIHCEVYGNPKPSVSWRKGSQYLTSGGRYEMFSNGTLLIRSASEMDIDSYTCTADNRVSQVVDRTIKLELREMLVARIENDNGRVMEGGRIRLTCEGRGYPVPTVTWEKNGRPLVTGDRVVVSSDGLLTIRDVTSAETGQYSCIVANSEEKIETSTSVQVVPKVMPDDKCEDKTALMKCRLIVRARLCGYRMYSKICCNTCRQSYNARRRR